MTLIRKFIILSILIMANASHAKNYFIFSVMHDLPMTNHGEKIKKNYYINLGQKQGVSNGTTLDVYRKVTQNDPYETNKRYDYKIKIGELTVIHNDKDSSIAVSKKVITDDKKPFFDIPNFMVGDSVNVQVN